MQSRFNIDGGNVHFEHMDLSSDGARSARHRRRRHGALARADLPGRDRTSTSRRRRRSSSTTRRSPPPATGDFTGTFHLFKGGRELKGTFTSPVAGVNAWRFPNLRGSVLWVPDAARDHQRDRRRSTAAPRASTTGWRRSAGPACRRARRWDVDYRDVDLARLTDFLETQGLAAGGQRAPGRNRLEWPLGKWAAKSRARRGRPSQPPPGVRPMTRELAAGRDRQGRRPAARAGPFNSQLSLGYLPVAGRIAYALDPGVDRPRRQLGGDREHLRGVRGPHRVRRAFADPVPRHQPRLAGERPRARRDHDRVRRRRPARCRSAATASSTA